MSMPALPDFPIPGPYLQAAALAAFPDDGNRYEVVHGELLVSPVASNRHQALQMGLIEALLPYLQQAGTAVLRAAPLACEAGPDTRVEPDLVVLPRALAAQVATYRVDQLLLVIEILSPSTARADRFTKRRLYQESGVPACWIVDPDAGCVEVWAPAARFPEVCRERLTWTAPAAAEPLAIDLAVLFTSA